MTTGESLGGAPWQRSMIVPLEGVLSADSPIREGWDASRERVRGLREYLQQEERSSWECVAVSGSYARMEGVRGSDLDLMGIVRDGVSQEETAVAAQRLREAIAASSLKGPSARGIFAEPIVRGELFAAPMGQIDEAMRPFGCRIQLLLDAQPVMHEDRFRELQRDVLRRYLTPSPFADRTECWETLVCDLSRYFRCLSLKYLWEDRENFQRWGVRNLKGWFSRPVMHVGLLMLLGESLVGGRDPEGWVAARLHLTPLERIASCVAQNQMKILSQIAVGYGEFLRMMSLPETREGLTEDSFQRMKNEGEGFQDLLVQVLQEGSGRWPGGFRRRLFL